MRILMGVEHLAPSDGVAVQSLEVAGELARRGHELLVVFENDGPYLPAWEQLSSELRQVTHLGLPLRRPGDVATSFVPAVRAARSMHPDVVYDNLTWTLPWATSVGLLARVPVLAHTHSFGPDEAIPRPLRPYLRRRRRVIAVSDFVRRRLISDYSVSSERVVTVHNGIDADRYRFGGADEMAAARRDLGLAGDAFVGGYYGRLHPTKGVHVLVEAARSLPALDRPLQLVIMGEPSDRGYAAAVRQQAGGLDCRWLPARSDVLPVLHAADVMVVPSQWDEPFGRAAVEPLATGRPVLAARAGGLPEVLSGPLERWLFERDDVAGLAAAIADLEGWQDHDPELGARCREHAITHFSFTTFVDAVERELVALGAAGRRGAVPAG